MRFNMIWAGGLLCAALCAATSTADVILIESDTLNSEWGLGEFTGSIEYEAGAVGTLTITLTNTSAPSNGGFLTAFVFNVNSSDAGVSASLTSSTHAGMTALVGQAAGSFGTFLAGAGTAGSFLGGPPGGGIAIGATGTFVFDIFASDAGSLSAIDFLIAGPNEFGFVTRFMGFDDDGSDMVPGSNVPAPGALALLTLSGLLCNARRRRT